MPNACQNLPSLITANAATIAGVLTEDEARRIASNIAKLPTLLADTRAPGVP
jgi:hypothetical protein